MVEEQSLSWLRSAPTINTPRAEALKLCDNEFGAPCGQFGLTDTHTAPLENIKLAITGSRIPLAGVRCVPSSMALYLLGLSILP